MSQSNWVRLRSIWMRGIIGFAWTFILFFSVPRSSYAQIQTGSFKFDGRTRNYRVFLPKNYSGATHFPLVIYLHSYGWTAQQGMNYTNLNQVADTANFIVAYPSAIPNWNSGIGDNTNWPAPDVDDVGFINALIDTLNNHYLIDLKKIYACGYSNGGFMSYKLACQLSHRIAAIASVCGVFSESTAKNFCPIKRMPILCIHGTLDGTVPNNGTVGWLSVDQTLRYWTSFNNCVHSDTISLPDSDPNDKSTVEKIKFTEDTGNYPVIYYKVSNGGHSWPGATQDFSWTGNTNRDMNASEVIWNFFKLVENTEPTYPAFAQSQENYPGYIPPQGGTLTIHVNLINLENHPVVVNALIQGTESAYQDSVELFDDGLHGDEDAADNLWGGKIWLSGLQEDWYQVNIITRDLTAGTIHHSPFESNITTTGPVVYVSHSFYKTDTIPNPGDAIRMFITLTNEGSTATATDLRVELSCPDARVEIIAFGREYDDIDTGEMVQNKYTYSFNIPEDWPVNTEIPMIISISSRGMDTWIDTFSVMVLPPSTSIQTVGVSGPKQFALYPNTPNPFNPSTTIRYTLPRSSEVTLTIYDLLGREITTLVNKTQTPGEYSVIWNGQDHPSGIYLCELKAGDFTETRKLVLQK